MHGSCKVLVKLQLDLFLLMIPENQIPNIVTWTNINLRKEEVRDKTQCELLTFFGIISL